MLEITPSPAETGLGACKHVDLAEIEVLPVSTSR